MWWGSAAVRRLPSSCWQLWSFEGAHKLRHLRRAPLGKPAAWRGLFISYVSVDDSARFGAAQQPRCDMVLSGAGKKLLVRLAAGTSTRTLRRRGSAASSAAGRGTLRATARTRRARGPATCAPSSATRARSAPMVRVPLPPGTLVPGATPFFQPGVCFVDGRSVGAATSGRKEQCGAICSPVCMLHAKWGSTVMPYKVPWVLPAR